MTTKKPRRKRYKRKNPDLPPMIDLETVHQVAVKALLIEALEDHGWSLCPAARWLGITEQRARRLCVLFDLEEVRKEKGPGAGHPRK